MSYARLEVLEFPGTSALVVQKAVRLAYRLGRAVASPDDVGQLTGLPRTSG
ncbi:MAG: hypothetical protein OXC19_20830 [Bryobacterales bacterium]|nr:hypothetical protein [Bryobacterales bacterium]